MHWPFLFEKEVRKEELGNHPTVYTVFNTRRKRYAVLPDCVQGM
jgi:hypothetical protein